MFRTKAGIIVFLIAQEALLVLRFAPVVGYPLALTFAALALPIEGMLLIPTMRAAARVFIKTIRKHQVTHASQLPLSEEVKVYGLIALALLIPAGVFLFLCQVIAQAFGRHFL